MIISLALPSNSSFTEKDSLVNLANEANIGIFMSDLPQNHDLFQLLAYWKQKYSNLPNIGTAIISPLIYERNMIKKQIKTIFEIHTSGIELGFGIGDKNLLPKDIVNRIESFQASLNVILDDEQMKNSNNLFSIAGSGKKLLNIANELNLGLIYNGLIDDKTLSTITSEKTRKNISAYIMADVNEYNSLTPGFITIVSRILTGLSSSELKRLNIDPTIIGTIKQHLVKKDLLNYKIWLPAEVIKKVALFGTKEDILEQIGFFQSLNIKQVILSIVGSKNKIQFIDFFKQQKKLNYI